MVVMPKNDNIMINDFLSKLVVVGCL